MSRITILFSAFVLIMTSCARIQQPLDLPHERDSSVPTFQTGPSPSPSPAPSSEPATSDRPLWTEVRYAARCDTANDPSTCSGHYGFTVFNSGKFRIGPAPEGQVLRDFLTRAEFELLNSALISAIRAHSSSHSYSPESHSSPTEELFIVQNGIEERMPIGMATWREVFKQLRQLSRHYYPDPFPNDCIDAAREFEKATEASKICAENADCVYLSPDFLPVEAENLDTVVIDDCSYITPLAVANAFEAVSHQLKLLMKRDLARRVCGEKLKRKSCLQEKRMDALAFPPLCIEKLCQIAPTASGVTQ
ncbi:MAG: hypothetical protein A2603_12620 [Bdellovibrionales bacterium RIFOXYD1_FULL_55_31]|nr:MAG: hypothetical protein A2603_12620 [Bdellovibrionales bacterium RIFOXYD1_FULL_55_31]